MLAGRAAAAMVAVALAGTARASEPVTIAYLSLSPKQDVPLTVLDPPIKDAGVQGARLALTENNTTGAFTGQTFALDEKVEPDEGAVMTAAHDLLAAGRRLIIADLPAALLLKVADLPDAKGAVLLDATSQDDQLRAAGCRANVLHMLPSRAMLADALMQYLSVKGWRKLLLVSGPHEEDKAYADALRRSARKFQMRIASDKPWTFDPGAQRTDTGHVAVGAEVARFTQGESYDVLVVADARDEFGDDLAYRTTDPRPIAGTQGLVPSAWAPAFEQWGSTQLQLRFLKQASRPMTDKDYGAWMAVRAVGEAATRGGGGGGDAAAIAAYLHGPTFELAAFKGARLSFRAWDGQLRQPVLLADARSLVSVSPQPGYLHQHSELDTLGIDQPETQCHM